MRIRGTLRWLCYTDGLGKYLSKLGVPLKEFKEFMQAVRTLGLFWAILNEPAPGVNRLPEPRRRAA